MTRLAKVLTSAAIGLTLTGTAIAQTAPDPTAPTTPTTGDDTTPTTTDTTTPTPTTTMTPDSSATVSGTVDTTVQTPPPVTVVTPAPAPTTYETTTPVVHELEHHDEGPASGLGIEIAAGGGAGGFVNDQLRSTTNVGGDWDVRATFGTRSPLALEGSYIGSAQGINALGLDNGAMLVGNGVQGALRLNATINFPVQPFIYAGAAWRRYDLTNTNTNLSDVAGSDDVMEIPMGVGFAARSSGFVFDVRGEYRATQMEDLLPSSVADGTSSAGMNRWGAKANIGIEF